MPKGKNVDVKKIDVEISKTKAKMAELKTKLRDLERQKAYAEDMRIVALFRNENCSEDEFSAFLHSQRIKEDSAAPAAHEKKEEKTDATKEN